MSTDNAGKLADVLRKVNALLTQADHPNTSPTEAEVFRAKAEALMFKYRIDEAMLSESEKVAMGISVRWLDMDICDARSEFRTYYYDIIRALITHLDVRADFIRTVGRKTGDILVHGTSETETGMVASVSIVGFESDLVFIQSMFAAARLAFSQRLEPKYDASKTEAENAYAMRSAGMEGWRIAQAIYGKTDKALRPKVRKLFAEEAVRRGEDPKVLLGKGNNMKLFRESYASGFISEYRMRLYLMRAERGGYETGLVLANRKEQIDEAFYTRFPDRRPRPVPQIGEADIKKCAKCEKAKSGYCADHRWMKPSAARSRVRYANNVAYDRGVAAARTVDIGGRGRIEK